MYRLQMGPYSGAAGNGLTDNYPSNNLHLQQLTEILICKLQKR